MPAVRDETRCHPFRRINAPVGGIIPKQHIEHELNEEKPQQNDSQHKANNGDAVFGKETV